MLLIFDIDGTLLDLAAARGHAEASLVAAHAAWGLDVSLDDYFALPPSGLTDRAIVRALNQKAGLAEPSAEQWAGWHESLLSDYRPASLGEYVFAGAPQALTSLQRSGHHLVLGTGNMEGIARAKLRSAGLEGFFQPGGGFGSDAWLRHELISIACGRAGVSPQPTRVAYVADTPKDVAAAHRVGVFAVAVTTGRHGPDELSRADLVLSSLSELPLRLA